MKTKGSKFFTSEPETADPTKLIQTIKIRATEYAKNNELTWIKKNDQLLCLFTISFDRLIGECGLAKLSELPLSVQNTLREEKRGSSLTDNYEIKVVTSPMIPTNCLEIQLKKTENKVIIDTAFPGILSVDFPDNKTQSKDEYEFNKWFWDNHVFLK